MQNAYNDALKFWSQFKMPQTSLPSVGLEEVVAIGKRDLEACAQAGQCVAEGLQTVARRQAELARTSVQKALKTTKDLMVNGSPEINTARQAEYVKTLLEQSLSNLREVSEYCAKSGFEAFDLLSKRAAQHFEEVGSVAKKKAA